MGGGTVLSSFHVRAVSVAWAPALAPVKHVPIVDVGVGNRRRFQESRRCYAARLLLVHTVVLKTWDDLFAEYMNAPPIDRSRGEGEGEGGRLHGDARTRHPLPAHELQSPEKSTVCPMVLVAREDGERMARLLAAGNQVWADLSIPNQIGGPSRPRT